MSLQIGRITGLNEPTHWESDGVHATLTGSYKAASLADGLIRRDNLRAYTENVDEPIIPVIWDNEPRVNGFYRVLGSSVTTDEFTLKQGNLYDYRLELEVVPSFQAPLIESTLIGALIPNAAGIVLASSQPWHAVPDAATAYSCMGIPSIILQHRRPAEDGPTQFTVLNTANYNNKIQFLLPAANFYTTAARLEAGLLTTPYTVVGRQAGIAKNDWRMNNGLVRVQSGTNGIQISWYDGSVWTALHGFTLTITGFGWGSTEGPNIRILRNAPEEAVIRVTYAGSGGFGFPGTMNVDLSLRRGSRTVEGYLSYAGLVNTPSGVELAHVGAMACTAITGGIRATANDANGNWPVLISASPVTNDLINGKITETVSALSGTFDFGIGLQIPGGNLAVAGNGAQDLVNQYVAGQAESQRVVVR